MLTRLHLITDDRILSSPDFPELAADLLGVLRDRVTLHLRGRRVTAARLYRLTELLSVQSTGSPILVNDRVDVAAAARADGVQLGERSLPIAQARAILGPDAMIGYSAHAADEAARAEAEGANFIILGTIYRTPSHPDVTPAGTELLARTSRVCQLPLIAIGGITAERIAAVRAAGAFGVAVIGAVWDAPAPVQAASDLVRLLENEV